MATLLHIDSAISPAGSASREVTAAFVKAWTEAHPDGKVVHRDLGAHPVPHLDFTAVSAGFSDPPSTPRSSARQSRSATSWPPNWSRRTLC
ncbi:NAD(P)H-dependent oxidoreductase [Actinomadura keratinilytica]